MKPLPIIGFDRYIPRHWLDTALAVAAGEADRGELVAMLEREIAGVEARSKTMIILNRMWLTPHPTLADFARAGVEIYRAGKNIDTLPLHWGMALASACHFPVDLHERNDHFFDARTAVRHDNTAFIDTGAPACRVQRITS